MTRHPVLTLTTRSGWRCTAYVEACPGESKTDALARIVRRLAGWSGDPADTRRTLNPPSPAPEAVTARGNRAA